MVRLFVFECVSNFYYQVFRVFSWGPILFPSNPLHPLCVSLTPVKWWHLVKHLKVPSARLNRNLESRNGSIISYRSSGKIIFFGKILLSHFLHQCRLKRCFVLKRFVSISRFNLYLLKNWFDNIYKKPLWHCSKNANASTVKIQFKPLFRMTDVLYIWLIGWNWSFKSITPIQVAYFGYCNILLMLSV